MSFSAGAADPFQIGRDDPATPENGVPSPDAQPDAVRAEPPAEAERTQPAPALTDDVVSMARAAAVEEAGSGAAVGDYLGAVVEDEIAVSAAFAALDRGYRGWYWSVTLAIVDPSAPTVSEVVLLPGQDALLAPPWVPWERRIQPSDLGAGDLLPTPADDIRLVPGYVFSDDPAVREVTYEFGLGRERVLSREGRDDAAERWHEGSFGPDDPVALAAPANCTTCAFFVPLAGLLGSVFGACANGYSPADGRVVDAGYGCGAHSQTVIDAPLMSASTDNVVDESILDVYPRPLAPAAVEPEPAAPVFDPEPDAEAGAETDVDPDSPLDADVVVELDVAWDLVAVADADDAAGPPPSPSDSPR